MVPVSFVTLGSGGRRMFWPVMAEEALNPMRGGVVAHDCTAAREGGQKRKFARTERATRPVLFGAVRVYAS